MKYTIEAKKFFQPQYRLQVDDTWRELDKEASIEPNDYVFDIDTPGAKHRYLSWKRSDLELELENKVFKVNATSMDMRNFMDHLSIDATLHRTGRIPDVSKEQLINVIRAGDDSYTNVLTLDVYGKFALHDFNRRSFQDLDNDLRIVARHEAFCQGNDYVGYDAADDKHCINTFYTNMLAAWTIHLATGRLHNFADGTDKSEEELLKEIEEYKRHH
ncbi:hypothetical protein KY330_05070 [Candidatus Woesearchaeota archaeon]|nr:hypothetical protein [Candidatus Woesearchaeota archaeon]